MSYSIVRFQKNEQLEILATFKSYEAADAAFDEYSDRKWPGAWLDIVKTAEAESVV